MSYTLLSGIAQNAKTPDTFWVPSDPERRAVEAGDCVKLMFVGHNETDTGDEPQTSPWVERMWVQVTHINYPHYRGKLDNQPFNPYAFGLAVGDPITFHARHIIDWVKVA